jgi:hypothetical protein
MSVLLVAAWGAAGHGASPENAGRCPHDCFPHPGPLPRGGGHSERAAPDFHGNDQGHPSAEETVIFKLKFRTAEELVPLLQEHIERHHGTVSGTGRRLVLTAPREEVARIQGILEEMDTRPHRLIITVAREPELTTLSAEPIKGASVNARGATVPDMSMTSYHTRQRPALAASSEPSSYELQTRPRPDPQDIQRVSVLEGQWALVAFGEAPMAAGLSAEVEVGAGITVFLNEPSTDNGTRILARATLLGQQLVVDVAYTGASPSARQGGQMEIRAVRTTLTGHLGEWMPLSPAADTDQPNDQSGLHLRTLRRGQDPLPLFVRVDAVANQPATALPANPIQ